LASSSASICTTSTYKSEATSVDSSSINPQDNEHQGHKAYPNFNYILDLPLVHPNLRCGLIAEDFSNIRYFCDGSHCRIFQAVTNNELIILKALSDSSLDNAIAQKDLETEINVLSRLSHPHIVNLKGFGFLNHNDKRRPILTLESLNGDTLAYHLAQDRPYGTPPFSKMRYIRMAKEFASALEYLHEQLHSDCVLIHRDLKPDNIGFTTEGVLKLLDFGLCVALKRSASVEGSYCLTGCTGSFRYMAPENALNKPYNEKVDMYSYGLIVYEMATGVTPYRHWTKEALYERAFHGHQRPGLHTDDCGRQIHIPDAIRELIVRCWDPQPVNRPTAREAYIMLEHCENAQNATVHTSPQKILYSNNSHINNNIHSHAHKHCIQPSGPGIVERLLYKKKHIISTSPTCVNSTSSYTTSSTTSNTTSDTTYPSSSFPPSSSSNIGVHQHIR
jgi:serine/threonine protein kinase